MSHTRKFKQTLVSVESLILILAWCNVLLPIFVGNVEGARIYQKWKIETVDPAGGGHVSIALDSNDDPHIVYCNEGLKYAHLVGSSWSVETVHPHALWDFGYSSIAIDPDGNPHICFSWRSAVSPYHHHLNYTYWDGFSWVTEIVEEEVEARHLSMALDSYNRPHISYYQHEEFLDGFLRHAHRHSPSLWTITELDHLGDVGEGSSIALDSNDRPHISYYDSSNDVVKYITKSDQGTWITPEIVDGANRISTSIALDSEDTPHVSYISVAGLNADLKLAHRTGSPTDPWIPETVEDDEDLGVHSSLAIDRWNNPHVAYTRTSQVAFARWTGTSWNIESVDSVVPYLLDARVTSLAIDLEGRAHICFNSESGLKYAKWTASVWFIETVDTYASIVSMALDSFDRPHICYKGRKWTGTEWNYGLKYEYWNGREWNNEIIDSTGAVDYYTSIALDSNDNFHISYYDQDIHALKYATGTVDSWSTEVLEASGEVWAVSAMSSIAVDSVGNPHACYNDYDSSTGVRRLKYSYRTGSGWSSPEIVDGPRYVPGLYNVIALDSNDNPHISYCNISIPGGFPCGAGLMYANKIGTSWEIHDVESGQVGRYSSIALDSNNHPHISYYEEDLLNNKNLKYARWTGTEWVIQTPDASDEDVGRWTSIALTVDDHARISYIDMTKENLKCALWNGTDWLIEAVDLEPTADGPTTLALDSSDQLHISYLSNGLRYATTSTPNRPPVADPDGPYYATASVSMTLIGSGSYDVDGTIISYSWDFGDGSGSTGADAVHTYEHAGDYMVALTVQDDRRVTDEETTIVHVNEGSLWVREQVDPGDVGQYTSIAMDSDDHPHISYYDWGNDDLKYANGTLAWDTDSIPDLGEDAGRYSSIALDSNSNPHISYQQRGTSLESLKYAYWADSWNVETVDSGEGVGMYSSIALDSTDQPHIAYYNDNTHSLMYAHRVDSSWNVEPVFAMRSIKHVSIALDSKDDPHISYSVVGQGLLDYTYLDGVSWETETVDDEGYIKYTSIALDSHNCPHISYYDYSTGDLKYASRMDWGWGTRILDPGGNVGMYTSIALDSSGRPHIAYYDETNGDLKYAHSISAHTWSIETVDWSGNVGSYCSLALDSNDYPHISYWSQYGGLMYVQMRSFWIQVRPRPIPVVLEEDLHVGHLIGDVDRPELDVKFLDALRAGEGIWDFIGAPVPAPSTAPFNPSITATPETYPFSAKLIMATTVNQEPAMTGPNIMLREYDGTAWSEPGGAPDFTQYAVNPAVVSFPIYHTELFLFWEDRFTPELPAIKYAVDEQLGWSEPVSLGLGEQPTAAIFNGDLYVVWVRDDTLIYKFFDPANWTWSLENPLGPIGSQSFPSDPMITVHNGLLYVTYCSPNSIYLHTFNGATWLGPYSLENYAYLSPADPAIASFNDELYIFYASDHGVFFQTYAGTLGTGEWSTPIQLSSRLDWWPMFQRDISNTGYSISTAPNTNHLLWNYTTGGSVWSSPAVVNDKVYVGSIDNKVYCINATTGLPIWNYTTGNSVRSSPAVFDGKVYFGSADREIYCLNATTGAFMWSYLTDGSMYSSPVLGYDKVYIGSLDGKVYCLNASTGSHIWNYTTGGPVYSSPAIYNRRVYVGSDDYNVYCLDATFGYLIWNYTTGGGIRSSPTALSRKVFFGSADNSIYCLDASTGSFIWSYATENRILYSSPAVTDGRVFFGSEDDKIYCLNATTGSHVWNFTTNYNVWSSPAVADGKLYVGSTDDYVYCLNASTGAQLWSYRTSHNVISSPAVADGKVYIGSYDNLIYAFGPPTSHDIAVTNIVPAKTIICLGCTMPLNVTVQNLGGFQENLTVTLYCYTVPIETQIVADLQPGQTQTLTFILNTTGLPKGNHTLIASSGPVPGEIAVGDNTLIDGYITIVMIGDITGPDGKPDGKCDMRDVGLVAKLFGKIETDPEYDPNCDVIHDGKIDMKDVGLVARHFGEIDP